MENVKVTVYLSTYNQEPYVAQALDSILMQKTGFPFEVVAADDSSTDRTQEIILDYQKRFPDKIVTYFTPENVGGCRKLTNCIDLGLFRGDYLSYLEGDDYWLGEDRLQTLVDFLEAHPEYAAVAHQRERVDEQGDYLGPDVDESLLDKPYTIENFLCGIDYSDFGSVFRNYFKNAGSKYHQLFWASRNVCDFQDMFIIQDFGPVFVMSRTFGAYRCCRPIGATNYNSVTTQSYRCRDHIGICHAVESFYSGKYDLTPAIQKEKGKLLRAAFMSSELQAIQRERDLLSSEDIVCISPSLLYTLIRARRWKRAKEILSEMKWTEKLGVIVRLIPYSVGRATMKLLGIHRRSNSSIRGYIRE